VVEFAATGCLAKIRFTLLCVYIWPSSELLSAIYQQHATDAFLLVLQLVYPCGSAEAEAGAGLSVQLLV